VKIQPQWVVTPGKQTNNKRPCFVLRKYVDNTEHRVDDKLSLRISETTCELSEEEAHVEFYSEIPKEEVI
jgi:hypothetical protein